MEKIGKNVLWSALPAPVVVLVLGDRVQLVVAAARDPLLPARRSLGFWDHRPAAPQHPAQLPDRGPPAVHARGHGARAPPVPRRERHGRPAVQPRHALDHLSSARRASRTRSRSAPSRTSTPRATRTSSTRSPRALWPRTPCSDLRITVGGPAVHAAVLALGPEHLGDELRRARRERRARDEHRRQDGQLRARHRRGRHLALPPRRRRRPDLADRHGLLRLPQAERRVRSRPVREERDGPAGQDDRDQGLAGREARARRHPPRREGDRGDRRGAARARSARRCSRRPTTSRSRRRSR